MSIAISVRAETQTVELPKDDNGKYESGKPVEMCFGFGQTGTYFETNPTVIPHDIELISMSITFSGGQTYSIRIDNNANTVADKFKEYEPSKCLAIAPNLVVTFFQ